MTATDFHFLIVVSEPRSEGAIPLDFLPNITPRSQKCIKECSNRFWREEIQNRLFGGKKFKIEIDSIDLAGRKDWL